MKTVWARVGMEITLTDEQYAKLNDDTVTEIVTEAVNSGNFIVNGESYLPDINSVGDDYDNFEEEMG